MRKLYRAVLCATTLAAGLSASEVQAQRSSDPWIEQESTEPSIVSDTATPPIATLQLESGSVVTFLELGAGRVGVAEATRAREPSLTDLLVRKWSATPLEMFIALAPSAAVPDALLRDHQASTSAAPRSLVLPTTYGVPIDYFDCDPPENFEEDWHDTYDGVTGTVLAKSYAAFAWPQYEWFPGAHAYYGTANNLVTHFGICDGDEDRGFTVQVHRRVTSWVDGAPQVSWYHKVTAVIGYMARFTFHTNLPGIYRMRLIASSGTPISQLAAGAAYTKEPPVGVILK